jgi:DNA-binding MarR family transcriptional regulator
MPAVETLDGGPMGHPVPVSGTPAVRRIMTLHQLAEALSSEVSEGLAATGSASMTRARLFALADLPGGQATAARLARWQRMSRQSATAVIDDLVARGYAERHLDLDNHRQLTLQLTCTGSEILATAENLASGATAACSASAPPLLLRDCFDLLDQMLSARLRIELRRAVWGR